MNPETHFLNVDLELVTKAEIEPLVADLSGQTIVLRDSVDEGRRTLWLELAGDPSDADAAILGFARLVAGLPPAIRRHWSDCDDRCLNVGIQSEPMSPAKAFRISSEAVAAAAAIGARLEFTVYAPDQKLDRGRQTEKL